MDINGYFWGIMSNQGGRLMNAVDVLKSREAVSAMRKILRAGPNGLRDEAFFVLGINTAFRVGDLLSLKVGDVLDRGRLRGRIEVSEKKTGKRRAFALNPAVLKTLESFLASRGALRSLGPGEPLFPSQKKPGLPICRQRAHQILQAAGRELGLSSFGPRSLRKTFGYHVYKAAGNDVGLVQKLLNHDSPGSTLRYIGVEQLDMDEACLNLNLY